MNDVVNRIPNEITAITGFTNSTYALTDDAYDYALAGIPFLSAVQGGDYIHKRAYTEVMAPIRKQQFDSFAEPGEQSLEGWWLRSQSNFTGGAGILYQDPDNDNQFDVRFSDSLGVNCWTSGELKLLRQAALKLTNAGKSPVRVEGYIDPSGVDSYWQSSGDDLHKVTDAATTSIVAGGGATIFDMTSTGSRYFLGRTNGIWSGVDAGAPTQYYTGTETNWTLEWLKGRLIGCTDNKVYQLLNPPSGAPVALPTSSSGATGGVIYAHQDSAWRWSSITDGPTAIYIAGSSGTKSEIHAFTATADNTGIPLLSWAGVTATMPTGEIINSIYTYVQSFIGIATNKGFRVGQIDGSGNIAYGPLLFTPTGGCHGITGEDTFMWVGSTNAHDGNTGLFRVNLGVTVQEQTTNTVRYAYARDIYYVGQGQVSSVTNFGASNRRVFAVEGVGSVLEDASVLLAHAYLNTGRIRFNTEEPKLYKFISIRTPIPLTGSVGITVLSEGGGSFPLITYGPSQPPGTSDLGIAQPIGPQNWIAFQFTLGPGTDPTLGGVLNGWQVKTLPGVLRQRIITQVFELFDSEQDKTGQSIGYDGYARARFESFQAAARAGDVVLYQELYENITTQVVIDDWTFEQLSPPGPNFGTLGGHLTVVLRTVADS